MRRQKPTSNLRPALLAVLFLFGFLATAQQAAAQKVLAQGTWTKKEQTIEGTWKIIEDKGQRFLVLDDAFRTQNAPDLKLFLSPLPLAELDGNNATEGAVRIAQLTSNQGGQKYPIPNAVKLDVFQTLILHCEQYAKLWGGANL